MTPRILPMGERALLVEVGALEEVLALHGALLADPPPGVVDLVPAARTVLVGVDPAVLPPASARSWILSAATDAAPSARTVGPLVELEVAYDGPDLAETAALLGTSVDALVRAHTAAEWTVAFTGFAPGFGYLVSPDWPFDVPRLASPRTRVPAGAVGLAAGFSGVYPRETPGGWRLLGTTAARLFDPDAASPALLAPGTRVRFRPVPVADARRSADTRPPASGSDRASADLRASAALTVLDAGPLATVQDLGRPGAAALGVGRSGAADRPALRTANRLVGNPEGAAGVEITMGGFRAVAERDAWIAVAGAWGPIELDGHAIDPYTAHRWPAGSALRLGTFAHGIRAYLAVRGGIDAPEVLCSRSADVLAGLGMPRLAAGDALAIGATPAEHVPAVDVAPWGAPPDDVLDLDLAPGPRGDWFTADARDTLFAAAWTVGAAADRVGVRLEGPPLARTHDRELPSEGMVPGALQVPPDGRPVILGADGPVTGGYPVIAVMTDAAQALLAQARPGIGIRFRHAPHRG